jgi:hypothetical protein
MLATFASATAYRRSFEPGPFPRYGRSTTMKMSSVTISVNAWCVLHRTRKPTIVCREVEAICYSPACFIDSGEGVRIHLSRWLLICSRSYAIPSGQRRSTITNVWLYLPLLIRKTNVSGDPSSLIVDSHEISHIWIVQRASDRGNVLLSLRSFIRPILPEKPIDREAKLRAKK